MYDMFEKGRRKGIPRTNNQLKSKKTEKI